MITVNLLNIDDDYSINILNHLSLNSKIKIGSISRTLSVALKRLSYQMSDILLIDCNTLNNIKSLDKLCSKIPPSTKIILYCANSINFKISNSNTIYSVYSYLPLTKEIETDIAKISAIKTKSHLESIYKDIFSKLGFNFSSKGTDYLLQAIRKVYNSNSLVFSIKDICNELALVNNVPANNIQWNMIEVLNSVHRYTSKHILQQVLPEYDIERNLSPKYFISLVLMELE